MKFWWLFSLFNFNYSIKLEISRSNWLVTNSRPYNMCLFVDKIKKDTFNKSMQINVLKGNTEWRNLLRLYPRRLTSRAHYLKDPSSLLCIAWDRWLARASIMWSVSVKAEEWREWCRLRTESKLLLNLINKTLKISFHLGFISGNFDCFTLFW